MRYLIVGVACGVVALCWFAAPAPSGDGVRPLLQSYYDAELVRVQLEARIAQAEIDALPTPQQR